MAPTPAPFDLNLNSSAPAPLRLRSGSTPAPLQTKICFKSLIFFVPKKYLDRCKTKNSLFSLQDNIRNHYFYKTFKKLLEPGAALIYASSDSSFIPIF